MGKIMSPEDFAQTPIGQLLAMGITRNEIAEITGVTVGAVGKWAANSNNASSYVQNRAKAYLDSLTKYEPKVENKETDSLFMVAVPKHQSYRFMKVFHMLSLEAVSLDD